MAIHRQTITLTVFPKSPLDPYPLQDAFTLAVGEQQGIVDVGFYKQIELPDEAAQREIEERGFDPNALDGYNQSSLDDQRIAVADSEFDKFDFGQWEIEQSHFGEWEIDQNTFVRAARAYPSPLSEPVKMIFTVTFFPESAEVQDTDCTVDGNEIIPSVE